MQTHTRFRFSTDSVHRSTDQGDARGQPPRLVESRGKRNACRMHSLKMVREKKNNEKKNPGEKRIWHKIVGMI